MKCIFSQWTTHTPYSLSSLSKMLPCPIFESYLRVKYGAVFHTIGYDIEVWSREEIACMCLSDRQSRLKANQLKIPKT